MKKHVSIVLIAACALAVCQGCGVSAVACFNPYNMAAAADGEDVYCSNLTGIYRIPGGDTGAEKIADGETIISIALHGGILYYRDNCALWKVDTDGGNPTELDTGLCVLKVACLEDTLYIDTSDGHFTADVASDPDVLTLVKRQGRPAPNGVFYSMEHIPGREAGCNLYRISPDTGEKTEVLHDVLFQEYIITDRWIFYHDEDGIYKADLDGQNSVKIIDRNNADIRIFFNYDDQYVYIGRGGFQRMDQETGELEPILFDANPGGFDIVNGYLYGHDHGEIVRMKLPDGETEFAPFE